MRTSNPALSADTFERFSAYPTTRTMTVQGTVNRTFILTVLALISASFVWQKFFGQVSGEDIASAPVMPWVWGGAIGGFIFAMVTIFKPSWAMVTAPIYVLLEGLFLGGISAVLEVFYPGIVLHAVGLTFGTLICMLVAYSTGLVRATEKFRIGVIAATGAIALVYFATIILGLFGVAIPYIHGNGTIGIGFSLFVVVIAALNLVLDFDFIEKGARMGAPKYMEWYGAFGLMVTLIWLYIEILRLLAKLRSRD